MRAHGLCLLLLNESPEDQKCGFVCGHTWLGPASTSRISGAVVCSSSPDLAEQCETCFLFRLRNTMHTMPIKPKQPATIMSVKIIGRSDELSSPILGAGRLASGGGGAEPVAGSSTAGSSSIVAEGNPCLTSSALIVSA